MHNGGNHIIQIHKRACHHNYYAEEIIYPEHQISKKPWEKKTHYTACSMAIYI